MVSVSIGYWTGTALALTRTVQFYPWPAITKALMLNIGLNLSLLLVDTHTRDFLFWATDALFPFLATDAYFTYMGYTSFYRTNSN